MSAYSGATERDENEGGEASKNVVPFQFEGEGVRVVMHDGEPWFVLTDVCEAVGISNPTVAVKALGDDERSKFNLGRQGEAHCISEGGLYTLVVRCRDAIKPGTAPFRFRKWVTSEVLPAIRKTGSYGVDDAKKMLDDPAVLQRLLLEKVQALEAKTQENLVLKPKAEAFDRIGTGYGSRCITDAAKVLQVQPRWLFNYLRVNGWIYRRAGGSHDVAYQQYIQNGCLEHKVTTVTRADGSEKVTEQVRVTDKGLAKLSNLLSTATKLVPAGEAA